MGNSGAELFFEGGAGMTGLRTLRQNSFRKHAAHLTSARGAAAWSLYSTNHISAQPGPTQHAAL